MRPPVVLALLAALALAAPAGAQRVHHQTLAVGDRALGMGGAFTGLASDQAAAWYNPAGLALIDRGTVSGSLLLHAFEDLRLAEGELRLAQERRSNFPLFATGVLRVGATEGEGEEAAPHHAFGVVVLRPLQVSRRFELAVENELGEPSSLFIDELEHETLFGFTWASQLAARWSLGASLVATVRRFEQRETLIGAPADSDVIAVRTGLTAVKSNHLILRVGALYAAGRFRAGLMIQPPGLPLRQQGRVEEQRVRASGAGDTTTFAEVQVDARVPVPLIARVGMSYRFERDVTLSVDLQFVGPVGGGAFVDAPAPGEEAPDEPSAGAFIDLDTERQQVLNGALGFEWRASRGLLLRLGAFTDFSTAREVPATAARYQSPRNHSAGGSGSLGITIQGRDINIGLAGIGGRGRALLLDPRSGVERPSYSRVASQRRVIYFFVTGSLTGH
ncbi:MAG TPA: hypothetical protein RMH85_33330 [Polyangiaceae bacterium LLY-WYZ-15_(1-7)]|nr:hypothetical protein [Myxococcales bacterium]MBJ70155.1 hypothetical protein [Sandaracinus sp.]HJL06692.1 hypothetical protein [Polyangiaceae bacterium LLY-WYZ-15_(1-7)]HJL13413.1 hypothetical protein [Polyangiaceae bacterium LLY-WYZ-15_(1-7)]HJL36659.1 hypothetical protein [Polyangiaceae bacterium LLY-WYZ-15_(1-7)]